MTGDPGVVPVAEVAVASAAARAVMDHDPVARVVPEVRVVAAAAVVLVVPDRAVRALAVVGAGAGDSAAGAPGPAALVPRVKVPA